MSASRAPRQLAADVVAGRDVAGAAAALARKGRSGVAALLAARARPWPADRDFRDVDADINGALAAVAAVDPAPVAAALDGADSAVRSALAWALGCCGHDGAVDALVALLGDRDAGVRRAAAVGLQRTRPARALDALIGRMRDRSSRVRFTALSAVAGYDDARVVPALERYREERAPLLVGEENLIREALARLEPRRARTGA